MVPTVNWLLDWLQQNWILLTKYPELIVPKVAGIRDSSFLKVRDKIRDSAW